jgi:RNA polymerase sigma-70 factor (ECF subfamily)
MTQSTFDTINSSFTEYRHLLINVAYRITNDSETAKDIVQDACLSVMEASDQFRGSASHKTYLYRIVINQSIDHVRRNKRSRNFLEIMFRERIELSSGSDRYEIKELTRRLFAAIPTAFRVPLILAEVEGMTYEEIADIMKLSINTVRTRIFRCREKLRKELEKLGILP